MGTAAWIVTGIVIVILLFCLFYGYRRGFLKIVLTTLALVVTIVAAGLLSPYLSKWLGTTFVGTGVEKTINTYIDNKIDSQTEAIINKTKAAQEKVIAALPIPRFLKKDISKKNETSEYKLLDVDNFKEYLSTRLSSAVISAIAFVLLLIVIYAVIRIILRIVRVIEKVPIVGGFNRILGALLCLVEGLLALWCICLLVTALSGTAIGAPILKVIYESPLLKVLYENNLILLLAGSVFKAF